MACIERSRFYEEYEKFKHMVVIKSVIKGRHHSYEKDTFELLEVCPEPDNRWDNKAFRVYPVMPTSPTYGHVPRPLNVSFFHMDMLADEVGVAYEIWW